MRIAICDDEMEYIEIVKEQIRIYTDANHIGASFDLFQSGHSLLASNASKGYDVIFLDVYMPDMDGLETAARIREADSHVQIVFVTYASETMPRGFEVMASGFIIKPIGTDEVQCLMDRLVSHYQRHQAPLYEIRLRKGGVINVRIFDIICLEKNEHYINAVTTDEKYEFRGSAETVNAELSSYGFVQIHRSY